jgi:hypothetical protein
VGDNAKLFVKLAVVGIAAYVGYRCLESPAPNPRPAPQADPIPVFALRSGSGFFPYAKVPYRWLSTRVQ